MAGLDIDIEELYREGMAYGRNLYAELWADLHPQGKPLMVTEITPELLQQLGTEATQILAQRYPRDVVKAMTGVK